MRRLVENRHVQINGNLCLDEGRKLQPGDVVKVWDEPRNAPPSTGRRQDSLPGRAPDRRREAGRSDDRAACGGAALALSPQAAAADDRRDGSADFAAAASAGRRRGGKPARPPRVRLVHRLDRDTSGVMVLAVSAEAERLLVQMFRKHEIHRVYHAIAQGRVEAQTIESSLVRDRGDRRRGSTKLPKVGKRAVTHVRPLGISSMATRWSSAAWKPAARTRSASIWRRPAIRYAARRSTTSRCSASPSPITAVLSGKHCTPPSWDSSILLQAKS